MKLHHEHYFLLASLGNLHLGAFSSTPDLDHPLPLKQILSPMVVYEEQPSILVYPLSLQRIAGIHAQEIQMSLLNMIYLIKFNNGEIVIITFYYSLSPHCICLNP